MFSRYAYLKKSPHVLAMCSRSHAPVNPRMMFSTSLQCSGRETIGRRRSETTEKRRDPKTRKRRTQRTRRRRANSSVGRNSLRLAARNPSSLGSEEEEGERGGGGGGGGTAREDFVLTPSSKHEAKPSIFFLPFSVCRGFPLGGARQTDRPKQATMQALVEV